MPNNTNPKIDAYIEKAQDFAKPILNHIRVLVHRECPEVEEKMKWSFPHFDYKGQMMCSVAAFKQHCALTFWKAPLLNDDEKNLIEERGIGMGHLGKITSLKDLPSDEVLEGYIKDAMKLNEQGIKVNRSNPASKKKELVIPAYFLEALKDNKPANDVFEKFSTSNKREYIDWLSEAKTEETRMKRLETAIEWIAEGKIRNWKYLKK